MKCFGAKKSETDHYESHRSIGSTHRLKPRVANEKMAYEEQRTLEGFSLLSLVADAQEVPKGKMRSAVGTG
jgi:hypothetical protein